jgi:hypothetical protein
MHWQVCFDTLTGRRGNCPGWRAQYSDFSSCPIPYGQNGEENRDLQTRAGQLR